MREPVIVRPWQPERGAAKAWLIQHARERAKPGILGVCGHAAEADGAR